MFPELYGSVCLKGAIKFYNGHEFSNQFKRLVEISIVNKSIYTKEILFLKCNASSVQKNIYIYFDD